MRRSVAAGGSAVFFALAPGIVAGLIPWWLTRWRAGAGWLPVRLLGVVVLLAGAAVLVHAFARFVVEGLGTPAPVAPPENLVVGGLYRHVRNPMYLAVVTTILGQALLLWRPVLIGYAALVAAAFAAFVLGHEQPALARTFGEQCATYRRAVPAWWPRLTPWRPGEE
jgi:protein-S-isoprenylcysteine O-methyltransferase Ste14